MDQVRLVLPTEEYLDQAADYRREMLEAGSSMDGTGALHEFDDMAAWLAEIRRYANPDTVPEGHVQATQFLAVRESDNRLVGMIQVRHCLNEYLETFGGHIGYSVRPGERRKGYAKEMLRLVLPCCKEISLDRALITCRTTNEGSRRTILSAGGVYESTVHEPDRNVDLERYWISFS